MKHGALTQTDLDVLIAVRFVDLGDFWYVQRVDLEGGGKRRVEGKHGGV